MNLQNYKRVKNDFGKTLEKLRTELSWTQHQMAEILNISGAYLCRIEWDSFLSFNTVRPWVDILLEKIPEGLKASYQIELEESLYRCSGTINFTVTRYNDIKKKCLSRIARTFDNISEDKISKIMEILKND